VLGGSVAALFLAGEAIAQSTAAPVFGPPLPGVCLLSQSDALARSRVGASAAQQLKQFANGIDAELGAERTAIVNDDHALLGQKPSLGTADYQQRVAQLKQRYAELDHTRALRDAQLNMTRRDAIAQVMTVLTPSLAETITTKRCSVVFERGATYGSADATDITSAVVQRMDARASLITLRLAPPDAVQGAR
jgi:outer membrane protein